MCAQVASKLSRKKLNACANDLTGAPPRPSTAKCIGTATDTPAATTFEKKTSGLSVSGKNKDIEGGSGQQARARVLGFYMEIAVRDSFF
jgi:hypothetical protein